ncbi:MAG: type II toxin-antitoxin system HipA family toxin [Gemmatimonas sp.]|nr:type II toxin-antitoxin system HipA family toxin [Gemmatimonas sp.]
MSLRLTRSAVPRLAVVLHGQLAGYVYAAANRRLTFRYEPSWQALPGAHALSLSMPLAADEHGHRATTAWLWGLLPDNPEVTAQWGRAFGVPRHDVVRLLEAVGGDCAGAVQLVAPDALDALRGAPTQADERTHIEWLTTGQVGKLLGALRRNPAAGRSSETQGQFSLAGAQPKTALYQSDAGKWGVPRGRVPSNRILKPPVLPLDDLAWNEHACLHLARAVGMAACSTTVQRFGKEVAIVVERYDRVRVGGVLRRVHQEDCCQALAIMPTQKYETDGGPSLTDLAALLSRHSHAPDEDVFRLLEAQLFNWLIGGTDAHAKNFALLLGAEGQVRLAPLYDVISALPYPAMRTRGLRLAMAVHGETACDRITGAHWRAVARKVGASPTRLVERAAEMATALPGAVEQLQQTASRSAKANTAFARLLLPIRRHAAACLSQLT